ncbi:aminopeptidase P family protein [Candidatus Peregrinibacteria bacterium]|nr:aminopeptidase P family protein [Candidatus Peregrinibacteria bacterium]
MQRIKSLQHSLAAKGLSALLVSNPPNVRYLCGFRGSNGRLLITPKKATLITDFRYLRSARKQLPRTVGLFDQKDGFKSLLKRFNSLGFEDLHLSYAFFKKLKKEIPETRLRPADGLVQALRVIKDPEEIRVMREACRIADECLERLLKTIRVGVSEDELEWNLLSIARGLGADGFSFPPIICFGKNTADVHHAKEPNRLKKGESILIDMGIEYRGTMTDMTRVFFTRKPTAIEQKMYSIVLEANQKASQAIRLGKNAAEIDRAARAVIEQAGYGKQFGHSTGHGVGLEVHEAPSISEKSKEVIRAGMVFTIEPGVYLNRVGGVRIEDMILVKEKGIEVLTRFLKEMRVIEI